MTWTSCNKHPNAHRTEACPGCHDEKIATLKVKLNGAVLDLMPAAMKILYGAKVKKIVDLIAEAIR